MKHFWVSLFLNAVRFALLLAVAVVLLVAGSAFDLPVCSNVGYAVLAGYFLLTVMVSAKHQLTVHRLIHSEENPELAALLQNPMGFVEQAMADAEKNKELHGEALLQLEDDALFAAVEAQNREIAEQAEDPEGEYALFDGARRVVYVLGLYDTEIQNGGLCQFFVNSSRAVAPYVTECLQTVGAEAHAALYADFLRENAIDAKDLSSFDLENERHFSRAYQKQTERYDFETFDNAYYALPPLYPAVCAYIRKNGDAF